jgi:zinc transporter, ZIP family
VGTALGWGALAASSLIIGALLAFARRWPDKQVGYVLAFGAGALISAVSFELVEEGLALGGGDSTALGLGLGAIVYFLADGALARRHGGGRGMPGRKRSSGPGEALALGAFLDGIPEQMVLGISVASTEGIGAALLVAVFVSNLPEAIGGASDMQKSGMGRGAVLRIWTGVSVVCVLASLAGYAIADGASGDLLAVVNGFAAGALLVLLIDSLIPEAREKTGTTAGLITVLGFAVAAGLSQTG